MLAHPTPLMSGTCTGAVAGSREAVTSDVAVVSLVSSEVAKPSGRRGP